MQRTQTGGGGRWGATAPDGEAVQITQLTGVSAGNIRRGTADQKWHCRELPHIVRVCLFTISLHQMEKQEEIVLAINPV